MGLNPIRWTQSSTHYHVAIKAGLYRKAVQVCYIPIPGDINRWADSFSFVRVYVCVWGGGGGGGGRGEGNKVFYNRPKVYSKFP